MACRLEALFIIIRVVSGVLLPALSWATHIFWQHSCHRFCETVVFNTVYAELHEEVSAIYYSLMAIRGKNDDDDDDDDDDL